MEYYIYNVYTLLCNIYTSHIIALLSFLPPSLPPSLSYLHRRPIDTRDALERERFHPFTPGQHLTYRIPTVNPDWYPKVRPRIKLNLEFEPEHVQNPALKLNLVKGKIMNHKP